MKSTRQVYEKVNPYEYEELKNFLAAEEHLQVEATGIDSFKVMITELVGSYNRNGNLLVLDLNQTDLSDDTVEDLQGKFTAIVGKPESGDKVQAFPLQTPVDPKTGLPVVEPANPVESDPSLMPGPDDVPEQAESSTTEGVVSGEAANPEGETQPPVEETAPPPEQDAPQIPEVTKKKKGHLF